MFAPCHFSIANGYSIGSFEAAYGLVHATMSAEARELWQKPELAAGMDQQSPEFFRLLLQITSTFHERRHYFDTFGTASGLSLFTSHQDCIDRFASVSCQLVERKITWQLPLSAWLDREDCPKEVKRFSRHLRSYKMASDVFSGRFSGTVVPGAPLEPWIKLPVFGGGDKAWTIPAFPISLGKSELIGRGDAALAASMQAATHFTAFHPIGYKAMIEGAAHLMARTIVETRFEGIDPQLLARYGPAVQLSDADEKNEGLRVLGELIGTYSAADLMVSRFLRQYAIASFERESVFKLIDIAMSSAELVIGDVGENTTFAGMSNPGDVFVDRLSSVGIAALHSASFDYANAVEERYRRLLSRFKATVQWTKIPGRQSLYAAPHVWRSFLSHKIIVPLLERRLKSRHVIFYKVGEMLKDMDKAPLPYVDVINDQLRFKSIPRPVQDAWALNMMLSEIAHQVFADKPVLRCPRAHHMLPGMKSVDLMIDRSQGSCQDHMDDGCGSWSPTRRLPLPDCVFKRTLTAYGFIPIVPEA